MGTEPSTLGFQSLLANRATQPSLMPMLPPRRATYLNPIMALQTE